MTKEIYSYLVMHILDMQKNKIRIVSRYSMDYEKYTAALDILNEYIHCIEDCVNKAIIKEGEHKAPIVIIGSTVDVRDTSGHVQSFTVIIPGTILSGVNSGSQGVSCFGAAGRALLLKKEGDQFEFEQPGGKAAGVIERIRYDMKL